MSPKSSFLLVLATLTQFLNLTSRPNYYQARSASYCVETGSAQHYRDRSGSLFYVGHSLSDQYSETSTGIRTRLCQPLSRTFTLELSSTTLSKQMSLLSFRWSFYVANILSRKQKNGYKEVSRRIAMLSLGSSVAPLRGSYSFISTCPG